LNAFTASQLTINTGYNTFTQSAQQSINSLNAATSSYITSSIPLTSLNAFTASQLDINTGYNTFTASANSSISNLNSATASLFNSASLALITASFSGNTLTFTKGDASTFGVIIPDISGSTIPAGTISGSSQITALGFVSSSITASSLVTASVSLNTITFTKGDASTFNIIVNTGSAITTDITALNSFTQSQETKDTTLASVTSSLNSATASLFTSASLALVTASVNLNTITFTKGDTSTFAITVNTGSGGGATLPSGLLSSSVTNFIDYSASVDSRINAAGGAPQVQDEGTILGNATSFNFNGAGVTATLTAGTASITIPGGGGTIDTGSFLTTGSFGTYQNVRGTLNIYPTGSNPSVGLGIYNTGSTVSGSMFFGVTDPGNPFIQLKNRNWFQIEGSDDLNYTNFTASFDNGLSVGPNFGSRTQMLTTSGSLYLFNPTTQRAKVMQGVSASTAARNGINLAFNNTTTDTGLIISGSNNIYTNPTAATAGFVRYIGGSGNIALNASNVPQISGSMAFSPNMNNNYFGGNSTTLTMRGPVSSSTYTISANIIQGATNIGSSAANNAEKAVAGFTMTGNSINGAFSFIANKSLHTVSNSITNNLMTATTLTAASSSIVYQSNVGGITVTNNASGGLTAFSANAILVNQNLFVGSSNSITATGSQDTGDAQGNSYLRQIEQNQILGSSNGVNLPYAPTGSNSLNQTMIAGYSLGVTGSNASSFSGLTPNQGSAFFGRYNAQDGNRAQSAQTVFAVGTGNSTTRKTGFLIDSGSNTFVEGTLNVSGSTFHTGSIYIQSGSWIPSATGSSLLTWNSATGQIGQSSVATLISSSFSVGVFNSTITQSGSSNVSQSMTYNNTDISNGVSIVSNSQITLANNGTYNIQFSAQVLAGTGADTIWIWLKKNGTNVDNTTTKLVLANNEANVAAWNFVVPAIPTDYFELVWQNLNGHATLLTETASGNYPAIPSVIVTVTQVE
jgi:hypothetical protein